MNLNQVGLFVFAKAFSLYHCLNIKPKFCILNEEDKLYLNVSFRKHMLKKSLLTEIVFIFIANKVFIFTHKHSHAPQRYVLSVEPHNSVYILVNLYAPHVVT